MVHMQLFNRFVKYEKRGGIAASTSVTLHGIIETDL